MKHPEIREHIAAFVAEDQKAEYAVDRIDGRTHRRLGDFQSLASGVDEAISKLCDLCLRDIERHPPTGTTIYFKLLARAAFAPRRTKRFCIECSDDTIHERCEDCGGSGWYVGLVERRHCPTCDGSGYL